ncbi:putative protein FAM10A4 [Leptidea sinapis]|uniref:STI1 domain-containing protein n=1 Tax=Leptidea sinapis TaxID=189913 RepID=A0A5E4R3Q8_9NEOP|nr:putative protein FAM10A4 [Leptidea sinapis]VVD04624.1 unnamed protein product [Leptidea sinapis]
MTSKNCPFNDVQFLEQMKKFIDQCKTNPMILHHPELSFFKDYLVSLGVTPYAAFDAKSFTASGDGHKPSTDDNAADNRPESPDSDLSDYESDVELDMEGVMEGDPTEAVQDMGDLSKEVTDVDRDNSDEKRSAAMRAFSEQKYEDAITLYTEAIKLNPQSALLFAKRGQVFLKLNKLYACIKDCSHALELNCDSAAAYKFRGRAYRLLGKFEEASHDLCESLKIDYDDQTNEWLNEVKPNAEKLRQHRLSVQRKKEEKEHSEKLQSARKAQEARAQAAREQSQANDSTPKFTGGFPAGMSINPQDFINLMAEHPDLINTIADPEVSRAFMDVSQNPENFVKYENNPKVMAVVDLFRKKFPGKMPFEFGASSGANQPTGAGPKTDDDVELD